jgi:hypothetical protein
MGSGVSAKAQRFSVGGELDCQVIDDGGATVFRFVAKATPCITQEQITRLEYYPKTLSEQVFSSGHRRN